MKIAGVLQARTASTRLPSKVLLPLAGKPLLVRFIERVQAATMLDEIVVATTSDAADEPIRQLCALIGVPVFSGHPTDLLDRHYRAGQQVNADVIVKIPSDCPLIDPAVIDRVVGVFRKNPELDFVSNLHPATYPDGNDVEVVPMRVLELAWKEADRDFEREHTTPFIWERPERFRIANVVWESGLDLSMSHRFTIDYSDDYHFIETVYDELHSDRRHFTLDDILQLLDEHPAISQLNGHLAGVNWYRNHLDELRTVGPEQTVRLA